jgi:glucose uptake protein GlcU
MDILMMRLLGRILMIIGALVFIVYGIVLLTKKQDNEEKQQQAKKNGKRYIWLGIRWLGVVIIYILI